jgi:7-cyano-7-deazaguanosine (preQ0) biosynthesis protein QueE
VSNDCGVQEALVVSEVFGVTLQGEGPSIGRLCGFVRLGRCNQACTWCDEPMTWDWSRYDPRVELTEQPVDEVLAKLDGMGITMVVITGGEPLLQQRALGALLEQIKARGWRVEIETAGTLAWEQPPELVDQFNVSPKLANSGNPLARRYKPNVLRAFEADGRAIFKFVVTESEELDEVANIVDDCGLTDIWIMPEATDAATLLARQRDLASAVLERGWNLTTRLHILLWGDRRGV